MEIKNAFISFLKERAVGFGIFLFAVLFYLLWGVYWSDYNRYHDFVEKHRSTDYKWVANDSLKTMELIYVGDSTDYPVDLIEYDALAFGSRISEFATAPLVAVTQLFSDTTSIESQIESSVGFFLSTEELLVVLSSAAQKYSAQSMGSEPLSSSLFITSQSQEPIELSLGSPIEIPAWDQFEFIGSEVLIKEEVAAGGGTESIGEVKGMSSEGTSSLDYSASLMLSESIATSSSEGVDSLLLHKAQLYALTLRQEIYERLERDSLARVLSSSDIEALSLKGMLLSYQTTSSSIHTISSTEKSVSAASNVSKEKSVFSSVAQVTDRTRVAEVVPLWRFEVDTAQRLNRDTLYYAEKLSSSMGVSSHQSFSSSRKISSSMGSSEISSEVSSSVAVMSSVGVVYFQESKESNDVVTLPSFSQKPKLLYYTPLAREWIIEFAEWLRHYFYRIAIPEETMAVDDRSSSMALAVIHVSLESSVSHSEMVSLSSEMIQESESSSSALKNSISSSLISVAVQSISSSTEHFTQIIEVVLSSFVQESRDSFVAVDTTRWWNSAIHKARGMAHELQSIFTFGKNEISDSSGPHESNEINESKNGTKEKSRNTLVRALYDHVIVSSSEGGPSFQDSVDRAAVANEQLQKRKRSRLRQLVVRSREEMEQKRLNAVTDSLYRDSLIQDSVSAVTLLQAQQEAKVYGAHLDSIARQHDSLELYLSHELARMDSVTRIIQDSQSTERGKVGPREGSSEFFADFVLGVKTIITSLKSTAVKSLEESIDSVVVAGEDEKEVDVDSVMVVEWHDAEKSLDEEIVVLAVEEVSSCQNWLSSSVEIAVEVEARVSVIDSTLALIVQQMRNGALKPRKKPFVEQLEFDGGTAQRSSQGRGGVVTLSSSDVLVIEGRVEDVREQNRVEYFVVGQETQLTNELLKSSVSENVSEESVEIEWAESIIDEEAVAMDGDEAVDRVEADIPIEIVMTDVENVLVTVKSADRESVDMDNEDFSIEVVSVQPTLEELQTLEREHKAARLLRYVKGSIADSISHWLRIDTREQLRLDSLQWVADSVTAFDDSVAWYHDSLQAHALAEKQRIAQEKMTRRAHEEADERARQKELEEREAQKRAVALKESEDRRTREEARALALAEKQRLEQEQATRRAHEEADERARQKELEEREAQKRALALKELEDRRVLEEARVLALAEKQRIEHEQAAQRAQEEADERARQKELEEREAQKRALALKELEDRRVLEEARVLALAEKQRIEHEQAAQRAQEKADEQARKQAIEDRKVEMQRLNKEVEQKAQADSLAQEVERERVADSISRVAISRVKRDSVQSLVTTARLSSDQEDAHRESSKEIHNPVVLRADSILQFVKNAIADSVAFWVETKVKSGETDQNEGKVAVNGEKVTIDGEVTQGALLEAGEGDGQKSPLTKVKKREQVALKKSDFAQQELKKVVEVQRKKVKKRYRYVVKNFKCNFGVAGKVYAQFDLELLFFDKKLKSEIKRSSDNIKAITQNIFYFTSKDKMQLPLIQKRLTQKMHYLYQKDIEVRFKNFETKIKNETSP